MAGSRFRYNITRPYPYRWLTPVVVAGFIVFLVLFSILNTVALGFDYVPLRTTDPNTTTLHDVWYSKWPSWVSSKVQPICQDAELFVGDSFTTNQSALAYTITAVWRANDSASILNERLSTLPYLTYHNDVLESCNVSSVEIDFSSLDRTATQQAFSEWGAVVRSYITCTMSDVSSGVTYINMTQEYDYVPASITLSGMYEFLGTNFLTRSVQDRSSLYWGESLLSMYWAYTNQLLATIRANQTANNDPAIRIGTISFTSTNPASPANMTDPAFFQADYRFFVEEGQPGNYTLISPRTVDQRNDIGALIANEVYPNIWQPADVLAKAAYSTILTDLGMANSTMTPNLLLDPGLLTYFTANFSTTRHSIANAYPGPSDQKFGTIASGPLGTTPSVLRTTYLCQVPHRKPAGTLFVLVLVADLVLLHALWFLFSSTLALFALRRRRDRDTCLGCIATARVAALPPAVKGMAVSAPFNTRAHDDDDDGTDEVAHERDLELANLSRPRAGTSSVDIARGRSLSLSRERLIVGPRNDGGDF
nr:hypothetical protein CFP56_42198 [Quercus suber]